MQTMSGDNDGLMQRLQLAVWPDEPKNWRNVDVYPNTQAKNRVYAIMETLADMDFLQYSAIQEEFHSDTLVVIVWDGEEKAIAEWEVAHGRPLPNNAQLIGWKDAQPENVSISHEEVIQLLS